MSDPTPEQEQELAEIFRRELASSRFTEEQLKNKEHAERFYARWKAAGLRPLIDTRE